MANQIYRTGEWERVGGVDGYSTIRAYLQPGLYETEAYARKKAAWLAGQDYENGGDGSFQVVAVGESPFDERRPSLAAWWATHPHVLDFDDCPSEETAMTRKTEDVPRPPRTDGQASAREAEGRRYSAEAVQREIANDRRIKPNEARLIHALLRGRG